MLPVAEQRRIVAGLQVAVFLAAIDQTLVSVSLLTIARELGGAALIAWVMAGYTVAATVATPVYGGLSDLYGRRGMMTIGIVLYMAGSLGCMLSQTMTQLLVARVVQGLGGGGLLVMAQSTIGDVVPPADRGRYQAWLSGTYALAALLGPITGGYLTTWFGWRFVFGVSLPLALLALLLTRRILGRLPRPPNRLRPDYAGVVLMAAGLTSLLIALTRIGQGAGFGDPTGAGLAAVALVLLWLFWRRQYRVAAPIMAPEVMDNRLVRWACLSSALVFFGLIGGAVMLPLALQAIARKAPDEVASMLLLHALAVPCGAFFSGRMMVRRMRLRRNMVGGALLSTAAAAALVAIPFDAGWPVGVAVALLGLGFGIALPPGIVLAQMSVALHRIGAATAFMALARSFGSALGLAVLTSVLFAGYNAAGGQAGAAGAAGGAAAILQQGAGAADPALVNGFRLVFACVAVALALSAVASMQLPVGAPERPDR